MKTRFAPPPLMACTPQAGADWLTMPDTTRGTGGFRFACGR